MDVKMIKIMQPNLMHHFSLDKAQPSNANNQSLT